MKLKDISLAENTKGRPHCNFHPGGMTQTRCGKLAVKDGRCAEHQLKKGVCKKCGGWLHANWPKSPNRKQKRGYCTCKREALKEAVDPNARLDNIIQWVLKHYAEVMPKNATPEMIRALVVYDYADGGLSKVTAQDVVEIIDASTERVGEDQNGEGIERLVPPPGYKP